MSIAKFVDYATRLADLFIPASIAGDRISAWNTQCEAIWAGRGVTLRPGMRFRDLLQEGLNNGAFVEAIGREREWLEERLATRRAGDATILRFQVRR